MPRIRKKTSKRGTTHQREKIKHKVAETRKKRKKESKKNTQWKSKQKKDPGIPNNFPYKDQILAEVAEQRRQAEEAKQRRKEERKAAKAAQGAEAADASDNEGSEVAFDGVASLPGAKRTAGSSKVKNVPAAEDMQDDEAPILLNQQFPTLRSVLEAADVVIEVLDARDPLPYHSTHIEGLVKDEFKKKLLLVLNKIESCPREAVSSWAASLRAQHPTVLFRSASGFLPSSESSPAKGKGKERADDALGASSVIAFLERWAGEKASEEPLVVAVVGVANSGKSSLINSLARKSTLPVYKQGSVSDGPSTTIFPQEILLEVGGKKIRLMDTPGLAWLPSSDATAEEVAHVRSRDILVRSRGRIDRLKDPEPVVHEIVSRASREDLMLFYNLPAFAEKDTNAFLSALARANGLIKKGGVLDTVGASRILLRDWNTGKFPRYTVPSASSASTSTDSPFAELYAADEKILATLPTRKERRKAEGVVKLSPSVVEARKADLDAPWVAVEEESDDEDAAGDDVSEAEDDEDAEGEEDEESADEEEEDEDEEDEPAPPVGKRKRSAQAAAPARPAKKVAFAAEPRNTRQARAAAGAATKGSVAKPALKAKAVAAKPVAAKKVANAAPSKKSAPSASAANGEEAYDFKKFF